jgi:hypothetical protein
MKESAYLKQIPSLLKILNEKLWMKKHL